MKILHLVLYSDNDKNYVKMYEVLSPYYKRFSDVTTYFYKYNENITDNIEITGNIINIKGIESYIHIPGILNKTINVLQLFKNNGEYEKYDYIIRSNISSIVNLSLLSEQLELKPVEYYGSTNVGEEKGIPFASGTNIILSKKGYITLVDNINLLDKTLIDDVSIAFLFDKLNIKITKVDKAGGGGYVNVPLVNSYLEYEKLVGCDYLVYRNKCCDNRHYDVINMNNIIKVLISKINYMNIGM